MTEYRDVLSGVLSKNFAQARLDARTIGVQGFGVRNRSALQVMQPLERAGPKFFLHRIPTVAGPIAKIHFAQIRHDDRARRAVGEQRRERLLNALHRAGVNGVEFLSAQEIRQRCGLFMTARRNVHVHASAKHFLVARFDFCVADEVKTSERHASLQ